MIKLILLVFVVVEYGKDDVVKYFGRILVLNIKLKNWKIKFIKNFFFMFIRFRDYNVLSVYNVYYVLFGILDIIWVSDGSGCFV